MELRGPYRNCLKNGISYISGSEQSHCFPVRLFWVKSVDAFRGDNEKLSWPVAFVWDKSWHQKNAQNYAPGTVLSHAGSMETLYFYIHEYQKNQPNVGKYAHGSYVLLGVTMENQRKSGHPWYVFVGGWSMKTKEIWTSCMSFLLGGFRVVQDFGRTYGRWSLQCFGLVSHRIHAWNMAWMYGKCIGKYT